MCMEFACILYTCIKLFWLEKDNVDFLVSFSKSTSGRRAPIVGMRLTFFNEIFHVEPPPGPITRIPLESQAAQAWYETLITNTRSI